LTDEKNMDFCKTSLKLLYTDNLLKVIFLLFALTSTVSCSNLGNKSEDTNECREVAYGKSSEPLSTSTEDIYLACQRKKESLRDNENKKANAHTWIEFFTELIF
jgi:hypothetical protein